MGCFCSGISGSLSELCWLLDGCFKSGQGQSGPAGSQVPSKPAAPLRGGPGPGGHLGKKPGSSEVLPGRPLTLLHGLLGGPLPCFNKPNAKPVQMETNKWLMYFFPFLSFEDIYNLPPLGRPVHAVQLLSLEGGGRWDPVGTMA